MYVYMYVCMQCMYVCMYVAWAEDVASGDGSSWSQSGPRVASGTIKWTEERVSGRVGEWESERVGERERGRVGEWLSGRSGE